MSRLIAVVACGFMLAACSATMPNLNLDFMKSAPQAETLALACLDYRRATTDHYIRDRTFATRTLAPYTDLDITATVANTVATANTERGLISRPSILSVQGEWISLTKRVL
jgi:hypothetical protein